MGIYMHVHITTSVYLFPMESLVQGGQLARVSVVPRYATQSGGGAEVTTDIKVKTSYKSIQKQDNR